MTEEIHYCCNEVKKKMEAQKNDHCCFQMNKRVNDHVTCINYNPQFREYSINIKNNLKKKITKISIYFCPWCSSKVSFNLHSKFYDILQKEYEISREILKKLGNKILPIEFKGDLWWKQRNISKDYIVEISPSPSKNKNFCCEKMNHHITGKEKCIIYEKKWRRYSLRDYFKRKPAGTCVIISCCPWCSLILPSELCGKFFETLQNEYNITNVILNESGTKFLPKEFKSDLWWKKRNL